MGRARPTHFVNLGIEAVAASTPYVLIDLSNATGFPHTAVGEIHLMGLWLNCEKAGDGVYDIWVGVIIENDATDGTAEWVHVFHLESILNSTDSTDRYSDFVDLTFGGIVDGANLSVTSGATPYWLTNQSLDDVVWQNDVNRTSPLNATTKVGVGDVVVYVEEVSGTGTIDFSLTAAYETA